MCFVSVTLSAGRPHSALFKWTCLQSVQSTAFGFETGAGVTGDLWLCLLSFPMLSAPRFCEWQDLSHSPVDSETTHRNTEEIH